MDIYKKKSIYGSASSSLTQLEDKYSFNKFEVVVPDIGLSEESKTFLATYNDVFRWNFKNRISISTSLYPKDDLDYSPLISELAKLFELELNLSIVQWMRREEGIEMPQYYNKYKECSTEYMWHGPVTINFNQNNKDGSLRGIPIGNAYCYAQNSLHNGKFPQEIADPKRLLSLWNKIKEIRNEASHSSISSFSDFEKMNTSFTALITENHFLELMELKHALQLSQL